MDGNPQFHSSIAFQGVRVEGHLPKCPLDFIGRRLTFLNSSAQLSRCRSLGGSRRQLIKIWGMYDNDSRTSWCIPVSDLFRGELQQDPSNYALIVKIWTCTQAGNLFIFFTDGSPRPSSLKSPTANAHTDVYKSLFWPVTDAATNVFVVIWFL